MHITNWLGSRPPPSTVHRWPAALFETWMDHNDRSQINTPYYYKYSNKNSDFVKVYHFSKDMSADFSSLKGILVKVHDVILRISFLHDSSLSIPPASWGGVRRQLPQRAADLRPRWGWKMLRQQSHEKGAPGCLGVYKGWTPTQLCGDYFINHKYPY